MRRSESGVLLSSEATKAARSTLFFPNRNILGKTGLKVPRCLSRHRNRSTASPEASFARRKQDEDGGMPPPSLRRASDSLPAYFSRSEVAREKGLTVSSPYRELKAYS